MKRSQTFPDGERSINLARGGKVAKDGDVSVLGRRNDLVQDHFGIGSGAPTAGKGLGGETRVLGNGPVDLREGGLHRIFTQKEIAVTPGDIGGGWVGTLSG